MNNNGFLSNRLFAFGTLTMVVILGLGLIFKTVQATAPSLIDGHKVIVCHATSSGTNLYNYNEIDIASGGHQPNGHDNHQGDIIPPYSYGDFSFAGLNWNDTTDPIVNNHCTVPSPTPTIIPTSNPTSSPTSSPSPTATVLPSPTASPSPSPSPTPDPTNTPTASPTSSPSPTPCPQTYTCQQCLLYPQNETQCSGNMHSYCSEVYDCRWIGGEVWSCVCPSTIPSPTVTPTPTPTPTSTPVPNPSSTPDPNSGKQSAMGKNGPTCENRNFEVTYDVKENGQARKDIEVTFEYNGSKKTVKTNENGRAQVFYDYSGEGTVKADDNGDYPGQSLHVDKLDCPATGGVVLGTSTGGRVLGTSTSTLGSTGTFTENMTRLIFGFLLGMIVYMTLRFGYRKIFI